MRPPTISVLIPTYNYAQFLPKAIDSVLAQDYADFEILLSDDGSNDGSDKIMAEYAARDPRIRFHIQEKNLGMVENWNWCLAQARGEYIKFVFSDDELASTQALTKLLGLMEANPSASLAASARCILGQHSKILEVWDHVGRSGLHPGSEVISRCLDGNQNLIGEPSVTMFRRRDAGRGFRSSFEQIVDLEMWYHLLEKGDLVYTSEPLCCFRRHKLQRTVQNEVNQVGRMEGLRLFMEYHGKSYLKGAGFRRRIFPQLYELRKRRDQGEESRRIEQELAAQMGTLPYAAYWFRHKSIGPIKKMSRWLKRRLPLPLNATQPMPAGRTAGGNS